MDLLESKDPADLLELKDQKGSQVQMVRKDQKGQSVLLVSQV